MLMMDTNDSEERSNNGEHTRNQFLSRFNQPKPNLTERGRKSSDDGWGGEGRGGYFKIKNKKLGEQNEEFPNISNIFQGVAIWVNGYTEPSADELRRLICENGGKYIHYFSKTHVTHTIAINIPQGKIKNLKNNDRIVHPNWITDSVKEGKLLPEDKYLVWSVAKRDGGTINFCSKKEHVKDPSHNADLMKSCHLIDHEGLEKRSNFDENASNDSYDEETDFIINKEVHYPEDDVLLESEHDLNVPILTSHDKPKQTLSKAPLKAGDKNYIEEYYAHSRLHHLSMWKSELKKFTSLIQEKWKDHHHKRNKCQDKEKLIMHIDMDSFFASVSMKVNPELKGKPIAVCHSNKASSEGGESWSEIASCNYEARSFGICNGMFLKNAKKLCPQLVCVPYLFDQYLQVSQKFYEIISKLTFKVQAVSCDEVLMDISDLVTPSGNVLEFADSIRTNIFNATQCTASCGIGNSILIARLATKRAKPNGSCYIPERDIEEFILPQEVKDLPGVGRSTKNKLDLLSIKTCADLRKQSLAILQKEFGKKFGETLYKFSRGIDGREIKTDHDIKSISAEINYGMRFKQDEEVWKFVRDLSVEMEKRMKDNKKKGRLITLKIMCAQKDAPNPSKYMGHGICNSISKSHMLPSETDDSNVVCATCIDILGTLKIAAEDYRGIGIQLSKLTDNSIGSTNTGMKQFAKPITSEELFKKYESERRYDNFQRGVSNVPLDVIDNRTKLQTQGNDPLAKTLPKLPHMELESIEPEISLPFINIGSSVVSELGWDPAVLEELPKDIQLELLSYQNNLVPQVTGSSTPILCSKNSKIMMNKESGKPKSPAKRRKVSKNTKKSKIDCHMQSKVNVSTTIPSFNTNNTAINENPIPLTVQCDQVTNISNTDGLLLSPSQMDQSVLQALPPDIRNDVMYNALRLKKKKNRAVEKNCKIPIEVDRVSKAESSIVSISSVKQVNPGGIVINNTVGDNLLLSPSQMDQSVLQALPTDIRNDVINEAKRAKNAHSDSLKGQSSESCSKNVQSKSNFQLQSANSVCEPIDVADNNQISQSHIDQNVFDMLPPSIQHEVVMANKMEKQKQRRLEENKLAQQLETDHMKTMSGGKVSKEVKIKQNIPMLGEAGSYNDVKKMLRSWVKGDNEPLTEDINEIIDYFHQLLASHNMESLFSLTLFLRRIMSTNSLWHKPFNDILKSVQNDVKISYSGKFPIKPIDHG